MRSAGRSSPTAGSRRASGLGVVGRAKEAARVGVAEAPGDLAARRRAVTRAISVVEQHRLLLDAVAVAEAQHHRHQPARGRAARARRRDRRRSVAAAASTTVPAVALERQARPADSRSGGSSRSRAPRWAGPTPRRARSTDRRRWRSPRGAAHVEANAVAEALLAEEALDHAQHGAALLVGDGVERLAGLLGVLDLGADGVRRLQRVERQRRALAALEVHPDAPLGPPVVDESCRPSRWRRPR